jgi:hypothetical protein
VNHLRNSNLLSLPNLQSLRRNVKKRVTNKAIPGTRVPNLILAISDVCQDEILSIDMKGVTPQERKQERMYRTGGMLVEQS